MVTSSLDTIEYDKRVTAVRLRSGIDHSSHFRDAEGKGSGALLPGGEYELRRRRWWNQERIANGDGQRTMVAEFLFGVLMPSRIATV